MGAADPAPDPAPDPAADPFGAAEAAASELGSLTGADRHDVTVVLGSGWGDAAAGLGTVEADVALAELPGVPPPTVGGHPGRLQSVTVGSRRVLVLSGRSHLYEGWAPGVVVHAVRAAVLAGSGVVVLTNAAGSLRPDWPVGAPVLLSDHLNLTGATPLAGPAPPERFGGRFADLTEVYAPRLRAVAHAVDDDLAEGVYAGMLGGAYETPAEIRMLRTLGADLVGMSTVLEAIAAHHLGAEVLGISLVTNLAAGLQGRLDHAEVLEAGAAAAGRMTALLRGLLDAV